MELSGVIKMVGDTQTFGDNGFRKREIVITTEEQYPQHIMCEFVQDKCDILNGYKIGENVTIAINLRGREWVNPQGETKYFNTIQGWKINRNGQAADQPVTHSTQNPIPPAPIQEEEDDDLPF